MIAAMTRRQREVLNLIAQGYTDRDIAGELYLSKATVNRHVQNIRYALGARNRAHAVSIAAGLGILAVTTPAAQGSPCR